MVSSVEPGESASNLVFGSNMPGQVVSLAPPAPLEWESMAGFLNALEGEDKASFVRSVTEHCIPRYYDSYNMYCRVAAGSPVLSTISAPRVGSSSGEQAVSAKSGSLASAAVSLASSGTKSTHSFSSRSRLRANAWQSSRVAKLRYPVGLCYSHAFKPFARESVSASLAFWPKFSQVLAQPSEACFSLSATESLVLVDGAEGYHITSKLDPTIASLPESRVWSYNDAMVGLSRRYKCSYSTYGAFLASSKDWCPIDSDAYSLLSPDDRVGGRGSPVRLRGASDHKVPVVYKSYVRRLLGSSSGILGDRLLPRIEKEIPKTLPAGYVLVVENSVAEHQARRLVVGRVVTLSEFLVSPSPFVCVWTRGGSEQWVQELCDSPGLLEGMQSVIYCTAKPNSDKSVLKRVIEYCIHVVDGKETFSQGKSYVDMLRSDSLYRGISYFGSNPSIRAIFSAPSGMFLPMQVLSSLKVYAYGSNKLFVSRVGNGVSLLLFLLAYAEVNKIQSLPGSFLSDLLVEYKCSDSLLSYISGVDVLIDRYILDIRDQVSIS